MISESVPEPMCNFQGRIIPIFYLQCSIRAQRRLVLMFGRVPCPIPFHWIVWYHVLGMMEYCKSTQLYIEEHHFEILHSLQTPFRRLLNLYPSLLLRDAASLRCFFYTQSEVLLQSKSKWANTFDELSKSITFVLLWIKSLHSVSVNKPF